MSHYRLNILDEHGATIGAVEFEATDDELAKGLAKRVLGSGHSGELWRSISPNEGDGSRREPRWQMVFHY
jgi:hypothetical protein